MDPYPDKPRITYRKDKTFKLVVFSDLHYGEAEDLSWGPQQDVNSARVMRLTLEAEKPDFVVINGDLITGDGKSVSRICANPFTTSCNF
jgi:metallophosphoesterase superfamily enzyme